jgi:hypothetical protein
VPIVKVDGKAVLRCLNHEHLAESHDSQVEAGTTMQKAPWAALMFVEAAGDAGVRTDGKADVVRPLICKVCGYVELYSGAVTEPSTWLSR